MNGEIEQYISAQFASSVKASIEGNTLYSGEEGIIRFAFDVVRVETLHDYQEEILRNFTIHKRIAVRGPHGIGKSFMSSLGVLWLISTTAKEDDVKIITTASAWRQLEKFLWPEINKWATRADWSILGLNIRQGKELLNLSLKIPPNKEAFAASSDNAATIEGAHAKRIGYVFDEAKAIPEDIFDAAEGAFSQEGLHGHEAYAFAISTPGDEQGRFYDIHMGKAGFEDWWTRHVTLEEAIRAGQISKKWAIQRAKQWGRNSPMFKRRALGEFASSARDNIIPLDWIEQSNERWEEWHESFKYEDGKEYLGVDPGGSGENADDTAFARWYDLNVLSVDTIQKFDTLEIVEYIEEIFPHKDKVIAIDTIGIGAGVYDGLRKKEYMTLSVNVSEPTDFTDSSGEIRFLNVRSMIWWTMREYLNPAKPKGHWVNLPPNDKLTAELSAPVWGETTRGVIQVEPKKAIIKRLKRSTNLADSVMLGLYASMMGNNHGIWL